MKTAWRGITGILAVLVIGVVLGIMLDRAILAHSHGVSHSGQETEHQRNRQQHVSGLEAGPGVSSEQQAHRADPDPGQGHQREAEGPVRQGFQRGDAGWPHRRRVRARTRTNSTRLRMRMAAAMR